MSNILIVDDEKSIRNTFEIFLSKEGHDVFLAEDAENAKKIFNENRIDLVVTDIIMPKTTGLDLLSSIKARNPNIPIIIMTGEPTVETAREAVQNDANDYLIKPVSKENLLKATQYALERKRLIDEKTKLELENNKYRKNLEKLVEQKTEALQKAINGTIETIVKILEYKDPYTAGHERRVGALALAIAKKLDLCEEEQKRIFFAGYLHDIGKLLVPSEILSKPGKLTKGEFGVIREHVTSGFELTKDINLSRPIADLILQHHERMDGSGYPYGLPGEEIQLGARILAVSDVIEAMTSYRPYRPGFDIEVALDEIKSNAGTLYDEEVSNAAIELFEIEKYDFTNIKNTLLV